MSSQSQWKEEDGMLVQSFECEDFRSAIDLVNRIAVVAEELGHHPEILVHDYKLVSVMSMTHEADAITAKDYELASAIDKVIDNAL